VVRARDLTRRYGDAVAVDGLNLEVRSGELYGFLGPNGAGKTTTLRMLTGLLRPTAGEVEIAGHSMAHEPERARGALGFVPDTPFLYDRLTAREHLAFCAGLFRVTAAAAAIRAEALLKLLELDGAADSRIETYSHGMRQKTALAGALIHDPQVLFLDEPTIGLDPRSARTIKDLLRGFCDRGGAVFLSTHVLEVAERLCDRVGILHRGRLLAEGAPAALRAEGPGGGTLESIFLERTGGTRPEDLQAFFDADPTLRHGEMSPPSRQVAAPRLDNSRFD
jgi:ABC-2 type transport system ATP-binding protein